MTSKNNHSRPIQRNSTVAGKNTFRSFGATANQSNPYKNLVANQIEEQSILEGGIKLNTMSGEGPESSSNNLINNDVGEIT